MKETANEDTPEFDHPLFRANSLRLTNNEGRESGMYNFLTDALIYLADDVEVEQHEVAHRIMNNYGLTASAFHVISELAGISHALLWLIGDIAYAQGFVIEGNKLDKLVVSVPGEENDTTKEIAELIESLLARVRYIESIIDMAWQGLVPIAEMAAIDFAEGVNSAEGDWEVWPTRTWPMQTSSNAFDAVVDQTDETTETTDGYKDGLIEAVIGNYPHEFGGYHLTEYGSFREALRYAWAQYTKIEDDKARQELLRLCMTLVYMDNNGDVQILDPVRMIIARARFAQEKGREAQEVFYVQRRVLEFQALDLVKAFSEVLSGLPEYGRTIVDWARALRQLIVTQADWQRYGLVNNLYARTLEIFSTYATQSFLRFEQIKGKPSSVFINSAFLLRAAQNDLLRSDPFWPEHLPTDWWRRLILIETVRQGLKEGRPLSCPFRGRTRITYEMPILTSESIDNPMTCDENCIIRKWLTAAHQWNQLTARKALCDMMVTGKDPN